MHDDGARWDERYRSITQVEPRRPEAVARWPDLDTELPAGGRLLDVACGPGAVALWGAERGFDVVALDASPVAIELLGRAAEALGHVDHIDARVVDLDHGLPADVVDLDLIVCQRFRDPALTPAMIDRLRAGGYIAVTVLSTVGAEHPGEFHAPSGSLWNEFTADGRCDVTHHHEGDGVAHLVACRR